MENYIQYQVMGSVKKIRMKPDCLPSKFLCHPDRINCTGPPQTLSAESKRQRMPIIQVILSEESKIAVTSSTITNKGEYSSLSV